MCIEPLEERRLLTVASDIVSAYNDGVALLRQGAPQYDAITAKVNSALGMDLPMISQTVNDVLAAADDYVQPFINSLSNPSTFDAASIQQLLPVGFTVQYAGLTPNNGDYLRINYHRALNASPTPSFSTGGNAGFDYLSNNAFGSLAGSLTTNLGTSAIDFTLGVDLVGDTPSFYLAEGGGLTFSGLSATGTVSGNIGIGHLLSVNATGSLSITAGGGVTLTDSGEDGSADGKLRFANLSIPQIANTFNISLSGDVTLAGCFTADLPILADLTWKASMTATLSPSGVSLPSEPEFTLPTIDMDAWALAGAEIVKNNFDLLGGAGGAIGDRNLLEDTGLGSIASLIGKESLGALLGIPTNLGAFQITTPTISGELVGDLIRGKRVDLFEISIKGGDSDGDSQDILLAAAPFAIGPIPFSVNVSAEVGYEVGYSYFAGIGIDTVGIYIDPLTHFRGWGGVYAGVKASLDLLGVLSIAEVAAGVGLRVKAGVGLKDPDSSDGRIYLDELVNTKHPQGYNLAESLLQVMYAGIGADAYGYARAQINLFIFSISLFDNTFSLPLIGADLGQSQAQGGAARSASTPTEDQQERTRQLPSVGAIPAGFAQQAGGTLTLSGAQNTRRNYVNVRNVAGGIEVAWSGVGTSVYAGVSQINFTGRDQNNPNDPNDMSGSDWFNVEDGVAVRVSASGGSGADYLKGGALANTLLGGAGDDTLLGGIAADLLYGEAGRDLLRGNSGNDTLDGGADEDDLYGDGDRDSLLGGAGADALDGGAGDDTLYGNAGNDFISGGIGNDIIEGGTENDYLFGEGGNDTIYGDSGEDILQGGDGNDSLYGGADNDLLIGDAGDSPDPNSTVVTEAGDDHLFGDAGNDTLLGGAGNDTLTGDIGDDTGNDVLHGGAGNDFLYGGANLGDVGTANGADSLFGGDGNDLLSGERGADQLTGGAGADTMQGGGGDDLLFLDFVGVNGTADDVLDGGIDSDTLAIQGTLNVAYTQDTTNPNQPVLNAAEINDNYADVIGLEQLSDGRFRATRYLSVGGAIDRWFTFYLDPTTDGNVEHLGMYGLGGDDFLFAAPGVDKNLVLDGGLGNDTLTGGDGRDSIIGGIGHDSLSGGAGADVLHGDVGNDTLLGGTGSDILYGGNDNDFIDGGSGRDRSFGEGGDDLILAGEGILGDNLDGGTGNDTLIGGQGLDKLIGGNDADILIGGDLIDDLDGGAGDDTLIGEHGRDILRGGPDNDVLYAYLANQYREEIALATGVSLPAVVPLSDTDIDRERDDVIKPIKDDLELVVQKINASLLYSPAHFATLTTLLAQSTLSGQDWHTLEQILRTSGVLTESQWLAFQLRVLDPDIEVGATVEQRVQTWTDYFVQIYSGLLDQSLLIPDDLDGQGGNDQLFGSPFNDNLAGGSGNDTIFHSSGNDTVSGGTSSDDNDVYAFSGTEQDDVITASLTSSGGGNLVGIVTFGNQPPLTGTLNAATLAELDIEALGVFGLGGNDTITVRFGNQATYKIYIDGGAGHDEIDASPVDGLPLQAQATLLGGSGNDTITGGLSDDLINGGDGDDLIVESSGLDTIIGGADDDRFVLTGAGQTFDLATLVNTRFSDIEEIDLTGAGGNNLILSPLDVINLAPLSHSLVILGNYNDLVRLNGDWTEHAAESIYSSTFRVLTSGQATVRLQRSVRTAFPAINLASLNGINGFTINGVSPNDKSGWTVSSAGDFNGDGFEDLIIGAYRATPNGPNSGASYVVFGKGGGFSQYLDLSALVGTNGFAIEGIDAEDFSGFSVSSAGDINGDGCDDLLIGALGADRNGPLTAGESYVVFGKTSGFSATLKLSDLNGINGFVINGIDQGDSSGRSVSSAGDINGDGFDDIIIGAYEASPHGFRSGESYVLFGKATGFSLNFNLASLNGANGFIINGIDAGDQTGSSVSSAGDINGDGFDDLLIAAFRAAPDGRLSAGETYVVFGRAGNFTKFLELSSLDETNGFVIRGEASNDESGTSVSSLGDFNGDGFDDLIIGSSCGLTGSQRNRQELCHLRKGKRLRR